MLVFEGRSGKSIAVGQYLESLKDNVDTLIVDAETGGIQFVDPAKVSYNVYHLKMRNQEGEIIKTLNKEGVFKQFKRIVLYLNVRKDKVEKYKKFEEEHGLNIILTVQTSHDDLDSLLGKESVLDEPYVVTKYEV